MCPAYPSLVTQLTRDVQESGLVQLLGIGSHRDEILQAIARRIVLCSPSCIESMNEVIQNNKHTLYLVISKCSHTTSYVTACQRAMNPVPSLEDNRTSDCRSVMSHSNAMIFYTSARPYALLTNRSLILTANEIHWPHPSTKQNRNHPEMSSGMEFCSMLRYESNVPVENWADVRDDNSFEEKVLKLCNTEKWVSFYSILMCYV